MVAFCEKKSFFPVAGISLVLVCCGWFITRDAKLVDGTIANEPSNDVVLDHSSVVRVARVPVPGIPDSEEDSEVRPMYGFSQENMIKRSIERLKDRRACVRCDPIVLVSPSKAAERGNYDSALNFYNRRMAQHKKNNVPVNTGPTIKERMRHAMRQQLPSDLTERTPHRVGRLNYLN